MPNEIKVAIKIYGETQIEVEVNAFGGEGTLIAAVQKAERKARAAFNAR